MATEGHAVRVSREVTRLAISTMVEAVATGVIEVGTATPVAPLCVALLKAKGVIDGASRNKEELEELLTWCDLIAVQVIDRSKASNISTINVAPLSKCVAELKEVAERCRSQGTFTRLALFRKDGDDIQKLRTRILAIVPIMGLAGVVDLLVRLPTAAFNHWYRLSTVFHHTLVSTQMGCQSLSCTTISAPRQQFEHA